MIEYILVIYKKMSRVPALIYAETGDTDLNTTLFFPATDDVSPIAAGTKITVIDVPLIPERPNITTPVYITDTKPTGYVTIIDDAVYSIEPKHPTVIQLEPVYPPALPPSTVPIMPTILPIIETNTTNTSTSDKFFQPDSFGKPGEGFHKHVFGIAIGDVIGTAVAGYLLAETLNWPKFQTIAGLFIAGEVAHLYYNVDTAVTVAIKKI
jgi:hypothetical protein